MQDCLYVGAFCLAKALESPHESLVSWTDVFPILSDDALEEFEQSATLGERDEMYHLFAVAKWFNRRPAKHVVASSLFWKPAELAEKEFPALTRELLCEPEKFGVSSRIAKPWDHYVAPLLDGARGLKKMRPDVCFRVYLANDLEFLIPELIEAGCEVALMVSSSLRHNPGAMWRFLALEDDALVTITDSDRAHNVIFDIQRTEIMSESGLCYWRVPYTWGDSQTLERLPTHYRPILACQFGSTSALPVALMMSAFVWHSQRGTLSTRVKLSQGVEKEIFGVVWPNYGFDEWFLQAALYPRMAPRGILTFVSWSDRGLNQWFALDVEYCTWANQRAEILFFDNSDTKLLAQPQKISSNL
jgi:hypothetical protein